MKHRSNVFLILDWASALLLLFYEVFGGREGMTELRLGPLVAPVPWTDFGLMNISCCTINIGNPTSMEAFRFLLRVES